MAKTLIVKKSDMSIVSVYEGTPNQSKFGGAWGESSHVHIAVPNGMDAAYVRVHDVSGKLAVSEYTEVKAAAKLAELRAVRESKLAATDWTQLPDVPFGSSEKANWAAYRQALRDITEHYQSLDTVVWPTEPPTEV